MILIRDIMSKMSEGFFKAAAVKCMHAGKCQSM